MPRYGNWEYNLDGDKVECKADDGRELKGLWIGQQLYWTATPPRSLHKCIVGARLFGKTMHRPYDWKRAV